MKHLVGEKQKYAPLTSVYSWSNLHSFHINIVNTQKLIVSVIVPSWARLQTKLNIRPKKGSTYSKFCSK